MLYAPKMRDWFDDESLYDETSLHEAQLTYVGSQWPLLYTFHAQRKREGDITGRPNFKPATTCGSEFFPLQPEQRSLPVSPVDLFQQFIPVSLVERWVSYTNEAPEPDRDPGPGSRGNNSYTKQPSRRGRAGSPTSTSEIYLWLAIQIYIGIHRETRLEDYWKVSGAYGHLPSHPMIKYMTFDRLHRRALPALQRVVWPCTGYECMIGFEGRAYEKTTVPSKPTPTGFKVWVVAQQGYFLQWIWHTPKSLPAGIAKSRGSLQQQGSQQGSQTEKADIDTTAALNPTQAVVVTLISQLPKAIYHVFLDNLFSSSHLFIALRKQGVAATGTARINSGIWEPFVIAKREDRAGKCWAFNTVKAMPMPEGLVNQIAWKNSALVLMYTTVYTGREFLDKVCRRPTSTTAQSRPMRREFGTATVKEVPVLEAAAAYNSNMGAVDTGDQLRATEGLDHRTRRGVGGQ
ncbi:Uncharacterized protein HZ326_28094 [Fusarium oxysporum f. sp. albedinis]|nr:Uncharacterized protein HZ326_28094 [Fusarium oxysporum f. sp. albedinis]